MAEKAARPMTPEEFYAWGERQDDRYELVDGFPVKMMTGASNYHDIILGNVLANLHPQLRGSRCWIATPDTALRTAIKSSRRPDLTVTCNAPEMKSYEAKEPKLVIEVLSPSNTGLPWQRKLEEYRRRDGLAYILLIGSTAIGATLYTRNGITWDTSDFDTLDEVIPLPDIACRLALRDVYEGLMFPDGETEDT